MKDLKTYIVESIKPPRLSAKNKELWSHTEPTPKDWDIVLSKYKSDCANYSQLCGLESYIDDNELECWEEWADEMIAGGCSEDDKEILHHIYDFALANYSTDTVSWRDDADYITDFVKKQKDTEWGVSEEDCACLVTPIKNLTGKDRKYGQILAKYGDSGDLETIIALREDF